VYGERFWERLWRSSGIIFVVFFIAYVIYGVQPKVGASADSLVSYYDGDRTRILMMTMLFGVAVLLLLWFAAAIRSALHDAGQGGWGGGERLQCSAWRLVMPTLAGLRGHRGRPARHRTLRQASERLRHRHPRRGHGCADGGARPLAR
jgi:succinate dehydrogenase/fumarate reductase cytochrome b subunit